MASVTGKKEKRLVSKRNGRGHLLGVIYWVMKWAWTSQKIKWKGEHEAEHWKHPRHCAGLIKDESQEILEMNKRGGWGWRGRTAWFWTEKQQGFPALQVSKQGCGRNSVCPTPHGRNKVTLGCRQESLRLQVPPLLLFNLLPARVIPKRGKGRSSPLLNDSTNLGFGFIFIPVGSKAAMNRHVLGEGEQEGSQGAQQTLAGAPAPGWGARAAPGGASLEPLCKQRGWGRSPHATGVRAAAFGESVQVHAEQGDLCWTPVFSWDLFSKFRRVTVLVNSILKGKKNDLFEHIFCCLVSVCFFFLH